MNSFFKIMTGAIALSFLYSGGQVYAADVDFSDMQNYENAKTLLNSDSNDYIIFHSRTKSLIENFYSNQSQLADYKSYIESKNNSQIKLWGGLVIEELTRLENLIKNKGAENKKIAENLSLTRFDSELNNSVIQSYLNNNYQINSEENYKNYLANEIANLYKNQLNFYNFVSAFKNSSANKLYNESIKINFHGYNDLEFTHSTLSILLEKEELRSVKENFHLKNKYPGDKLYELLLMSMLVEGNYDESVLSSLRNTQINVKSSYFNAESQKALLIDIHPSNSMATTMKKNFLEDISYEKNLFKNFETDFKEKFILSGDYYKANHNGNLVEIHKDDYDLLDKYTALTISNTKNEIIISFSNMLTGKDISLRKDAFITFDKTFESNNFLLKRIDNIERAIPNNLKEHKITLRTTKLSGNYLIKESSPSKFEDIANNFAKDSINFLENRRLVAGIGANSYGANTQINRASFAVMLSRALELENLNETHFLDTKGKWYEAGVQALFEKRLIAGINSNTFGAERPLTRQDAAVIINRLFNLYGVEPTEQKSVTYFRDYDKISSYAESSIKNIVSLGIMSGKPNNLFDPTGNLTRAEMAKILHFSLIKIGLY